MFAVSLCISVWFKWHQFLFDASLFLETDYNMSRVLILPRDNKSGYCSKPTCLAYLSFVGSHSARFSSQLLAGLCIRSDLALLACMIEESIVSSIKLGTILVAFRSRHISAGTIRLLFAFFEPRYACAGIYQSKQESKQMMERSII